jgi:hypothetical protein
MNKEGEREVVWEMNIPVEEKIVELKESVGRLSMMKNGVKV